MVNTEPLSHSSFQTLSHIPVTTIPDLVCEINVPKIPSTQKKLDMFNLPTIFLNRDQKYTLHLDAGTKLKLQTILMIDFDTVADRNQRETLWRTWWHQNESAKVVGFSDSAKSKAPTVTPVQTGASVLDIHRSMCSNVLICSTGCSSINAVHLEWQAPATVVFSLKCLSSDFSLKRGVKGTALRLQLFTLTQLADSALKSTPDLREMRCDTVVQHQCRMNVFRDKGAERKIRELCRRWHLNPQDSHFQQKTLLKGIQTNRTNPWQDGVVDMRILLNQDDFAQTRISSLSHTDTLDSSIDPSDNTVHLSTSIDEAIESLIGHSFHQNTGGPGLALSIAKSPSVSSLNWSEFLDGSFAFPCDSNSVEDGGTTAAEKLKISNAPSSQPHIFTAAKSSPILRQACTPIISATTSAGFSNGVDGQRNDCYSQAPNIQNIHLSKECQEDMVMLQKSERALFSSRDSFCIYVRQRNTFREGLEPDVYASLRKRNLCVCGCWIHGELCQSAFRLVGSASQQCLKLMLSDYFVRTRYRLELLSIFLLKDTNLLSTECWDTEDFNAFVWGRFFDIDILAVTLQDVQEPLPTQRKQEESLPVIILLREQV